jgi:transposase
MSLWPRYGFDVPVMTERIARAAFPRGSPAIRMRDARGEVFADGQFADLFAVRPPSSNRRKNTGYR